jgi:hypothetical protein
MQTLGSAEHQATQIIELYKALCANGSHETAH